MAGDGEEVYVAAIYQGTTSTRFIIYDRHVKPVASHQLEFKQHYPEAGWVEHDPMEIIETVKVCMAKGRHNVDAGLKAIGIKNRRETTVMLIYLVALLSDQLADIETTALGAAYAAGLAARVWTKEQVFAGLHKENTIVFRPKLDETHRKKRSDSWYKAVSRSFDLADLYL